MTNRLGEIRENNQGTKMKIVQYRNYNDIDVEFMDDFHYTKRHQAYSNFKTGSIKNPYDKTICGVGYIGVGKYQTGTKTKHTEEYQNWTCMIRRCYDESLQDRYSAYYGDCIVCEEWHCFQTFAKWWNDNIYRVGTERMHLDKDILIKGNRIYSPKTCLIVPQRINMMFMKKPNKFGLPCGIKPRANGKFEAQYKHESLGVYDTLEQATMVHDIKKKDAIVEIAKEYRRVIPIRLYEVLVSYNHNRIIDL